VGLVGDNLIISFKLQAIMNQRIAFEELNPGYLDGLIKTSGYLKRSGLDQKLMALISYRVSQINGCAYCLDMHHKDAIQLGETEQRLHSLAAWRECPYYSDKERAVLAFVEAVNGFREEDAVFEALTPFFSRQQIADVTMAISLTIVFNHLNRTFRITPGNYQPGQHG
jgi:AhpD family alkylhydroperoxidase